MENSLETYVQEAMCQLTSSSLTDTEQTAMHALLCDCSSQLDSPPGLQWSALISRARQWQGRQSQRFPPPPSQRNNSRTTKV